MEAHPVSGRTRSGSSLSPACRRTWVLSWHPSPLLPWEPPFLAGVLPMEKKSPLSGAGVKARNRLQEAAKLGFSDLVVIYSQHLACIHIRWQYPHWLRQEHVSSLAYQQRILCYIRLILFAGSRFYPTSLVRSQSESTCRPTTFNTKMQSWRQF